MKFFNKYLFLAILGAFLISLSTSCEKEGPEGPKGLDGKDGVPGLNGKDGTNGKDGKDGNANVKSVNFVVEIDEWIKDDESSYHYEKDIPAITEQIANTGDVRLYVKTKNYSFLQPLPYTYLDWLVINYGYKTGKIRIDLTLNDPVMKLSDMDFEFFKVVIIEGSALAKSVNYNNYEEVKAYYNLE